MRTTFELAEELADTARLREQLASAEPEPYWLDDPARPAPLPRLEADVETDLAIVGGGYSGLWTALLAKERDPDRRVVLLEGRRIAWAASGRNGGFCEPSLTHGSSNGKSRLPHEFDRLEELGRENLREIGETIARYGMDCDWEETGLLQAATAPHHVDWLRESAEEHGARFLDREAMQAEVHSPIFQAGLFEPTGAALVNPAKLAWELRRVCLDLGVEIHEYTHVRSIRSDATSVTLTTTHGSVVAKHVALGTNVFKALIPSARKYTVPVYDYALMTNPLSAEQLESLGWKGRQGISDLDNRFHYSRLTTDANGSTRILYGGYDAVYNYGGRVEPRFDQREESFLKLAAHFAHTYPQLADLGFSHKWGGAIDTCGRFFSFFETAHGGKVAHAAGFTGLGVGATRYGANVMLDLLSGTPTERTTMDFVQKKPTPFPPDPLAFIGARISLSEMARADRNEGKRGLWLRTMDAVGLGFDS